MQKIWWFYVDPHLHYLQFASQIVSYGKNCYKCCGTSITLIILSNKNHAKAINDKTTNNPMDLLKQ